MGIRFRCHHCQHELHVKDFQGGKRGRCPACKESFRVPLSSAELSLDPDSIPSAPAPSPTSSSDQRPNAPQASQSLHHSKSTQAVRPSPAAVTSDERTLANAGAESTDTFLAEEQGGLPNPLQPPALATTPLESPTPQRTPTILREAPNATWYVRPEAGGQYGPATGEIMLQWLEEERIGPDSLVWRDDWAEWQVAAAVLGDHFAGPAGSAAILPEQAQVPLASAPTIVGTTIEQPSLGDRNREARKRRRRRNYAILIAVLFVVFVVLLLILSYVLVKQWA